MNLTKQKLALLIITPIAVFAVILVFLDIYNQRRHDDKISQEIEIEKDYDLETEGLIPDSIDDLSERQREILVAPERVAPSNPHTESQSNNRDFKFNLKDNNLININSSGKQINVYKKDIIELEFTAIDKDYDIYTPAFYSQPLQIKAGETENRRFQAVHEGSFVLYCGVCGGEESEASILINVIDKEK